MAQMGRPEVGSERQARTFLTISSFSFPVSFRPGVL